MPPRKKPEEKKSVRKPKENEAKSPRKPKKPKEPSSYRSEIQVNSLENQTGDLEDESFGQDDAFCDSLNAEIPLEFSEKDFEKLDPKNKTEAQRKNDERIKEAFALHLKQRKKYGSSSSSLARASSSLSRASSYETKEMLGPQTAKSQVEISSLKKGQKQDIKVSDHILRNLYSTITKLRADFDLESRAENQKKSKLERQIKLEQDLFNAYAQAYITLNILKPGQTLLGTDKGGFIIQDAKQSEPQKVFVKSEMIHVFRRQLEIELQTWIEQADHETKTTMIPKPTVNHNSLHLLQEKESGFGLTSSTSTTTTAAKFSTCPTCNFPLLQSSEHCLHCSVPANFTFTLPEASSAPESSTTSVTTMFDLLKHGFTT
jgi:hypothetical protein